MRLGNLWYRSAIIYEVDVRTFYDSDGDGWGDFQGLIQRLDYIAGLGATAIWLKPFNTSPHRDGGYDVTDYYAVDHRIGTLGDFVDFMEEASSRGIAVITELVANHTSIDHPWFQESASSVDSPLRDFYIWREEPLAPEDSPKRIVWSGDDTDVWTEEPQTGQYYMHRFYEHQPDLNNANPSVRDEISKVLAFYLRLGVAGFRIDAAPYVAGKAADSDEFDGPHEYLKDLRHFLTQRRPDAVFMAEADVEPKNLDEYFGAGDEMNLLLNFVLSQYLFLALAEEDASSLREMVEIMPKPPESGQFANFLRNHDELDLERLSAEDRQAVFDHYAPEPEMRVYGRGIRRRAAPMLDGEVERMRLAYSLLFAMPGTPIIYYGDEIGMGDDLSIPERQAVHTPMQWDSTDNGGFSTAPVEDLYMPPISKGPFAFHEINVMEQRGDPDSMLNWMRRLIAIRKEAHGVATGDWEVFDGGEPSVLGIRYRNKGDVTIIYHNLSREPARATLPEGDLAFIYEIFSDHPYGHELKTEFTLNGSGYRWLIGQSNPQ
ncbi:MAG TPA: alpha-amylase family protein [Acidimicrobiia bacterium]|nr:alpha-amylase family protein [Acidimicrobiia bacterium]